MKTQTKIQTIGESLGWILFTLRMSARRRRHPSTVNHPTINQTPFRQPLTINHSFPSILADGQMLLPGVDQPRRWDVVTGNFRREMS